MNDATSRMEMKSRERWDNLSLKYFLKCVNDATAVYFKPSTTIEDDDIQFGELLIEKSNGEIYELSKKLIKEKMASSVPPEDFLSMFNRTNSSVLERWNDNSRSGFILEIPENIIINEIGEAIDESDPKHNELSNKFRTRQMQKEIAAEKRKSIEIVEDWILRNAGIKPEKIPYSAPKIDRVIPPPPKLSPILKRSPEVVSPLTPLTSQPTPSVSPKASNLGCTQLKGMRSMKEILASFKATQKQKETSQVDVQVPKAKVDKIILVPAGSSLNTNSKSPSYVDRSSFEHPTETSLMTRWTPDSPSDCVSSDKRESKKSTEEPPKKKQLIPPIIESNFDA